MKKIIACGVFLAIALIFVAPQPAHALTGFGGTVLTTYVQGVACAGEGPIVIRPKGLSPAGPYAAYPFTMRFKNYFIKPGAQIVGAYIPFLIPGICWTTTPIPVPVPVFPIIMFGTNF